MVTNCWMSSLYIFGTSSHSMKEFLFFLMLMLFAVVIIFDSFCRHFGLFNGMLVAWTKEFRIFKLQFTYKLLVHKIWCFFIIQWLIFLFSLHSLGSQFRIISDILLNERMLRKKKLFYHKSHLINFQFPVLVPRNN